MTIEDTAEGRVVTTVEGRDGENPERRTTVEVFVPTIELRIVPLFGMPMMIPVVIWPEEPTILRVSGWRERTDPDARLPPYTPGSGRGLVRRRDEEVRWHDARTGSHGRSSLSFLSWMQPAAGGMPLHIVCHYEADYDLVDSDGLGWSRAQNGQEMVSYHQRALPDELPGAPTWGLRPATWSLIGWRCRHAIDGTDVVDIAGASKPSPDFLPDWVPMLGGFRARWDVGGRTGNGSLANPVSDGSVDWADPSTGGVIDGRAVSFYELVETAMAVEDGFTIPLRNRGVRLAPLPWPMVEAVVFGGLPIHLPWAAPAGAG